MKRNFWIGLLIGCLGGLLLLAFVGAVAAQSNRRSPAPEAQSAASATFDSALQAVLTRTLPTGGGGPGPLGTIFSYQGLLKKNGVPFAGNCDMQFKLYDAQSGGNLLATVAPLSSPVAVDNGLFTTYLDFGDQFKGDSRYLEPLVSCPASGSPGFQSLGIQAIFATPYALSLRPGATISSSTRAPALEIHGHIADNIALSVDNMSSANYSTAIYGNAWTGRGVVGYSLAPTGTGVGVWGITNSPTGEGIAAQGAGSGAALALHGGNIKVNNAGIGTNTPVFIHQVKTGIGGNICSGQSYSTVINNSLINGNPNAILIVTPNYGRNDTGVAPAVSPVGVYYDATNQCNFGAGRWVIYNYSAAPPAMNNNQRFNVMAVVP